jgi:predicted nucleic acid-binding protein
MKSTVYIETTIVSYLTARPSRDILRLSNQITTQQWWKWDRHRFSLFASELVAVEASRGDRQAAAERLAALQGIPELAITPEVDQLSEDLIGAMRLTKRARPDAIHVAIAAAHGMSFLLTWNCRHLANAWFEGIIRRTCERHGQVAPRIVTPAQLTMGR